MVKFDFPMEIAAIFSRWVRKLFRRPTNLTFSMIQPLIWFLLFTQAFQAVANIPGFAQIPERIRISPSSAPRSSCRRC